MLSASKEGKSAEEKKVKIILFFHFCNVSNFCVFILYRISHDDDVWHCERAARALWSTQWQLGGRASEVWTSWAQNSRPWLRMESGKVAEESAAIINKEILLEEASSWIGFVVYQYIKDIMVDLTDLLLKFKKKFFGFDVKTLHGPPISIESKVIFAISLSMLVRWCKYVRERGEWRRWMNFVLIRGGFGLENLLIWSHWLAVAKNVR